MSDFHVVLAGNPNVGKSTIFNGLVGARQRVSNYPGVTVERRTGAVSHGKTSLLVTDLPGIYSLKAFSMDERIAADVILGRVADLPAPDLILFVLDSTSLERSLTLYTQLVEMGAPIITVVTMLDELRKQNKKIDLEILAKEMNCPVVDITSGNLQRINRLHESILKRLSSGDRSPPEIHVRFPDELEYAKNQLLSELPGNAISPFEARELLLFRNYLLPQNIADPQVILETIDRVRSTIPRFSRTEKSAINQARFQWAISIEQNTISRAGERKRSVTSVVDSALMHRYLGVPFFLAVMFIMFQAVYSWSAPFMDMIEYSVSLLGVLVEPYLASMPAVQSLVINGILGGFGGVLVFLPQIIILFTLISILEDIGYMARVAFMMDRLLGWAGLSGRAFVPMLSGFACSIPAIIATRVLAEERSRLATILAIPFISCSARLPVYTLFIGAFIEPIHGPLWASAALLFLHLLGLFLALFLSWFQNEGVFTTSRPAYQSPFILDIPPYRIPRFKNVYYRVQSAALGFLRKAGTVIFALTIVVWAASAFPLKTVQGNQGSYWQTSSIEESYLGQFGKSIQPIFEPLGFDWKITVAILGSFPAREVFVSTFGIVFSVDDALNREGESTLQKRIQTARSVNGSRLYNPVVAISVMVFFALSSQCMSTLAVIRRELNSLVMPLYVFVVMTSIAYGASFLTYQLGMVIQGLLGDPLL